MIAPLLLLTATLLYAGYNLLIKVSGTHVPEAATSTVLAVICLQLAALTTSITFAGSLLFLKEGQHLQLTTPAYLWAAAAGLCIGGAEIAYFYLFGGIGAAKPMAASLAIPTIVSGTIVITLLVSWFILREPLNWNQWLGSGCIVVGIVLLFLNSNDAPA
ncbi:MAG TPA: EamA family transporter [Kiloniellales bacterium]